MAGLERDHRTNTASFFESSPAEDQKIYVMLARANPSHSVFDILARRGFWC
jgi:hypothetical protein